eukprot:gene23072-27918_t
MKEHGADNEDQLDVFEIIQSRAKIILSAPPTGLLQKPPKNFEERIARLPRGAKFVLFGVALACAGALFAWPSSGSKTPSLDPTGLDGSSQTTHAEVTAPQSIAKSIFSHFTKSCDQCTLGSLPSFGKYPPAPLLYNAECPCDSKPMWSEDDSGLVPFEPFACRKRHKSVAVMIHFGIWTSFGVQFPSDEDTAEFRIRSYAPQVKRMKEYLLNTFKVVGAAGMDVYINVRTPIGASRVRREVQSLLGIDPIITLATENRGRDIGALFINLMAAAHNCASYDAVYKLHAKTNAHWFSASMDPLMGSQSSIRHSLSLIQDTETPTSIVMGSPIRMLANATTHFDAHSRFAKARFWLGWRMVNNLLPCGDLLHFTFNVRHMDAILNQYEVPIQRERWGFVAGTTFAFKFSSLVQYLNYSTVPHAYGQLNTPSSIDWNWYSIVHELQHADKEEVKEHFMKANSIKYNLPGSSLNIHFEPFAFPDGEVEHAWERTLCIMLMAHSEK